MKDMKLKQQIKNEHLKLKKMSSKDRIWYISEYYKFHILGLVLLIGFLSIIGQMIYNRSFTNVLSCIYINAGTAEQPLATEPLTTQFRNYLSLSDKETITTEKFDIDYEKMDSEMNYLSFTKITALAAAKELDVIIADEETIKHYSQRGFFLNIEDAFAKDLLTLVQDQLFYAPDEEGIDQPFAIALSATDFAADSNLNYQSFYLGIVSNSRHTEYYQQLIRYIFQSFP